MFAPIAWTDVVFAIDGIGNLVDAAYVFHMFSRCGNPYPFRVGEEQRNIIKFSIDIYLFSVILISIV